MEDDIKENYAKIIQNKIKQIQAQAEKYESKVKLEVKKIIEIEEKIKVLKNADDNEEEIIKLELEIKEIRKVIKEMNKEKYLVLGCEMDIGFNDDLCIKSDMLI
jgi:hypothetical protein